MSMRWIGFAAPHPRQFGIGVADVAGDGVIEGPEVLEIVEKICMQLTPFKLAG